MKKLIKKTMTTTVEVQLLADDAEVDSAEAQLLLEAAAGNGKDDDGDVVAITRRGAPAGRVNLALPPVSRTRARTGRAPDTDDAAQAHLHDDGGHGDDKGEVVEASRGGARPVRAKPARPPISRTRARTDRAHDTEDEGEAGRALLDHDGGHADDDGEVVEASRGGARSVRAKPAQPPLSRTRGRNDR